MWTETDPRINCVVQSSLSSFRHELLVVNFEGIPTMLQHGDADDNVPTFHSRRFNQLAMETGEKLPESYSELPNEGHWYDGVMTTAPLRSFYERNLDDDASKHSLPDPFQLVVANPGEMGSRGGVSVDQLCSPGQLGKIRISRQTSPPTLRLETSNVKRFHFTSEKLFIIPSTTLIIDNDIFKPFPQKSPGQNTNPSVVWYVSIKGSWKVSVPQLTLSYAEATF